MNRKGTAVLLFLLCWAGMGPVGRAGAEPLNKVVAVVNKEVITLHELNKRIKEATGRTPDEIRSRGEEAFLEVRKKILEQMIDERITADKIQELGIKVSQRQVNEAIERLKQENGWTQEELVSRLGQQGISYEKYLEKMKGDLERYQLIHTEVQSKILITEDRIKSYYEEHKSAFTTGAKVRLAGIFLVRKNLRDTEEMDRLIQKGQDILKRLKDGESFEGVAREVSDGPGADEGGDLGVFSTSNLEPELRKIVEALPVGGVSDLVARTNGIQIVKLLSKEGGETKPLDAVRNAIYSSLYQQEVNERYTTWITQLRERSYTKITF